MGRIAGYGFRFGDGGGGLGIFIPASAQSLVPFADNAARDVWANANPADLVNDRTVVFVTGTPNVWYIWRGPSNPATPITATDWETYTDVVQGNPGPQGATGPQGPGGNPLADEAITADLTISAVTPNNIATYRNKNVVNERDTAGSVTVTMDTIASFLVATPGDEFVIQFINDSTAGDLVIVPGVGDQFGQIQGNISLSTGQAARIKLPRGGTTWSLLSDTVNSSGTTTPQRPDAVPLGDVVLIGQWDPTTGAFPAGASEGNLYEISTAGTVDGITFSAGDFIIALVNAPSTTTFFANWQIIDGSGDVHSWAGMQGILTDTEISAVLNRLGFGTDDDAIHDNVAGEINAVVEKTNPTAGDVLLIEDSADSFNKKRIKISSLSAANIPRPSLHNFSVDIPSRVDLNTNLNIQHTITFDVSNHSQLTALTLILNPGTNQTLTVPVADGVQTQTVTFAGTDTSVPGTLTLQLSGAYAGGTVTSNTETITVANLQTQEQGYYGVLVNAGAFATEPLGNLTAVDVSNSGTVFDITAAAPNGRALGILLPANRDAVSILNTTSNRFAYNPSDPSVVPSFTLTQNVRVEGGLQYNLLTTVNNSGFDGTFNYRVTTE